ncbi:putative ribonuclease H-like domain-containing protein [Tanacetum coccineum]
MTRNKSYLTDYQDIDGGFVAFAGSPKGGKITGKGKIRTGKLDFEDNNMYSFDLKNVVPSRGLTCLFTKATIDESNLWHRSLGHINFNTMYKLVRGNLVRGLPSKLFENDHSCVACQKGKQHKASWFSDQQPHKKTPYELLLGRPPSISFTRPVGCPMTILNTLDPLEKFDGKADEGFLVGYSINNKAFLKGKRDRESIPDHEYILLAKLMLSILPFSLQVLRLQRIRNADQEGEASNKEDDQHVQDFRAELDSLLVQQKEGYANSTNRDSTASPSLFEQMMHKRFQMSSIGELTFFLELKVQQKEDGILISQDKYVADILKKFDFVTVKTASTPMDPNKALVKDEEADNVDVHLYRLLIRSLMYLTASRPDIPFDVCACGRDSPFYLEAFFESDYVGASLDKKFTIGGCQFLGKRLISWQCKKQTIVANSTTEAEYVAAANCCGQVLWIQNQMLDYGFNFMNTKIYVDNESIICIVKNPVIHSKTKHIEIRHHFIRDSHEKKLIQVIKIHTNHNVADLLTKAFDFSRFNFLIASIGMLNLLVPLIKGMITRIGDAFWMKLRYTLTKNLTIYVSLIEKFWQTATVRTVDNGEQEINVTVDGTKFTINVASVRASPISNADGV